MLNAAVFVDGVLELIMDSSAIIPIVNGTVSGCPRLTIGARIGRRSANVINRDEDT